jgi:hypothetical protein
MKNKHKCQTCDKMTDKKYPKCYTCNQKKISKLIKSDEDDKEVDNFFNGSDCDDGFDADDDNGIWFHYNLCNPSHP